jgi:UDP-glucuronate decarboxylase
MIEGFVRLMDTTDDFTGPVNLGNPGEFTIHELAGQVLELTGSTSRLDFMPLPDDDPRQRKPDIALAKDALGWEPTVKLRDGLLKTIEYFDNYLKAQ